MTVKMSGRYDLHWETQPSLLSLWSRAWSSLFTSKGRINSTQILPLDEPSLLHLLTAPGPQFTRKGLLRVSKRTKDKRPAFWTQAAQPTQCFNCSGKNEAFISHSIFKKKISCDILVPCCARAFLEFSPASHLECFVSLSFSWIAYYEPWPTIKNNATVTEWKSRSLGYSGLWVSIQTLTSVSPKAGWGFCGENRNELWDENDHLWAPVWFMFLWNVFCKWFDWVPQHFS